MVPHRFGRSPAFSVGLEEELFVVDPRTLEVVPVPAGVLDGKRLKAELFRTVVELNTGPAPGVPEAVAELRELRREARRRLRPHGLELAAVATWPSAVPEEQPVTAKGPLKRFVEYAGATARRQHCSGLHVHVGLGSPEECMERMEAVLPWLPLVLALSANSPYLAGEETGLASARAELLGLLPRSGAPPAFADYEEWARFAESLVALGLADDLMRLWWDVRPHPRFGTLEVRMPDQPTRLAVTAALAALAQALVAAVEPARDHADRGLYLQNRWAASRFGAEAGLVHPDGGRLVGPEELLAELLELVEPVAERLGGAPFLGALAGLDQAGDQLALGRAEGLRTLGGRLVELTYDDL
ncbi:MAG TPA: YbdK family carboxylate-amine ligase [Gaiellaceae bacterium]|nr:YbdK family carboxylate-amine ligase [Gaiellaceae bacterium]